jgi:hypothetical protein
VYSIGVKLIIAVISNTIMASSLPFITVVLREDDVPGAALIYPAEVSRHSVIQLKRWLECRSLNLSGNKDILVEW